MDINWHFSSQAGCSMTVLATGSVAGGASAPVEPGR